MSLFSRLKKLWALSDKDAQTHMVYYGANEKFDVVQDKPVGMATVVQDDPLDLFPSESLEDNQQNDA